MKKKLADGRVVSVTPKGKVRIVAPKTDPVVSSDIIKDQRASVVDLGMTQVVDGDLVKVMSWYDNEWGYSSRCVDLLHYLVKKGL